MIFLLELPLLLTILPPNPIVWPGWIAAYLTGCFFLEKAVRAAKPRLSLSLKMFFIALPVAAALEKNYVHRTHLSGVLAFLESLSGAPSEQIISFLAPVLGGLSAVSLLVLMGLAGPALQRRAAQQGMPLSPDVVLNGNSDRLEKKEICFCALLSVLSSMVLFTLFPLYKRIPEFDVSVFLYIGREMAKGRVPYRDMFDHKGPIFYFIQCIGNLLSLPGTYSGVWLLELLNLFVFCLLLYKLTGLVSGNRNVRRFTVLLILCGTAPYGDGNWTEEFTLPWIAFALYIFLLYFLSGRYQKKDIFFLGLSFGVVFFLKANAIAVWACLVPVTLAVLIARKRSREILPCIGLFTLGLATVCIPILAYTLTTGSLDEMIRYYFLFNMEYCSAGRTLSGIAHSMLYFLYSFPVCFGALTLSVFYRAGDSRSVRLLHFVNALALFFSLITASITGEPRWQYGMPLLPLAALPVCNMVLLFYASLEKIEVAASGQIYPPTEFRKGKTRQLACRWVRLRAGYCCQQNLL